MLEKIEFILNVFKKSAAVTIALTGHIQYGMRTLVPGKSSMISWPTVQYQLGKMAPWLFQKAV